ncbi:MAG: hypothetical protein DWP97_01900 [Calditrichaeota bacterium]|nr:MAG: hypothetical protein DWP97_01900 [Calditrichota bacterium]
MRRFILLSIALLFIITSCNEVKKSDIDINAVLDNYEVKSEWLNYRLSLEYWDYYTTGKADSLDFYNGLFRHLIKDDDLLQAVNSRTQNFTDEDDRRRFELVKSSVLSGQIDLEPDIVQLKDSLSNIDINYRAMFEGEQANTNELYQIYRTDKNRTRREAAYRAYVSVGEKMQDGLSRLFKLRNQKAKKLGYNNYFGLSLKYQGIELHEYMDLLKQLDTLSENAYDAILASIKDKTGLLDPNIWDLAFAYNDIYKKVDAYFPVDSQMRYVDNSLEAIGYDLEDLPIYFDLESRDGKSQFAYAFTIKAPYDMRILANLTDGILSTKTLMHEVGHALHSAYIRQDRSIFSSTMIEGIWAEAMGQTMAALVNEKEWLTKYAHMPTKLADDYLKAKRELDIIYLRTTLLRLHFEFEAYNNPNRDLNQVFWELSSKYLKISQHEDLYPWASIIHYTTHPVYLHNYLYADMIAAQNIYFLKDMYNGVIDRETTKSFLSQNYFRFGAKYDWRELLKRGTDSELDTKYYLTDLGL